ncbi:MAG: phosphoadenylyl-sulfate reductase [Solirubrobacterales bacterium]|nr:phosphoadenylyl-sulfate reductase [Solirubrobacterales bacterium]
MNSLGPTSSPTPEEVESERSRFGTETVELVERLNARQIFEWAFDEFGERFYIACSFQKTSSVMVHLAVEANPDARFFYLDTGLLFEETYRTRDRLEQHFGVSFDRWAGIPLEEQAERYGERLWERDIELYNRVRKVEPMQRALTTADCWAAGIRRQDSATRAGSPKLLWDERFGIWKVNPLADWSEREVWAFIYEHDIPYNPLHDQGYPSIGCKPLTRPVRPGESDRDGRLFGSNKTECGIN